MPLFRPLLLALCLAAIAPPLGAAVPSGSRALALADEAERPSSEPFAANLVEVARPEPPAIALRIEAREDGSLILEEQQLGPGISTIQTFRQVPEGGAAAEGELPLEAAPAWLLWLAGRAPSEIADLKGIDRKRTTLSHRDAEVLVVIGAGPRDEERPQLHVERSSGRLVRTVEAGERPYRVEVEGRFSTTAPAPAEPAAEPHTPSSPAAESPGGPAEAEAGAPPEDPWPSRLLWTERGQRRVLEITWRQRRREAGAEEAEVEPREPEESQAPPASPAP